MNARSATVRVGALRIVMLTILLCSVALLSPRQAASHASKSSETNGKPLTTAQMAQMSSEQLGHYVFENHGCKNCHTLGADGKLGFTPRGKLVGKNFEGCISLLTSMGVIAQLKPGDRSPEEKQKEAHFREFGCTLCHEAHQGKLQLTAYGDKLKSFHMACTDVERVLAQQK